MGVRHHFVCHECAEEGVYSDRSDAETAEESHVKQTGHDVSLRNISDPTV